MPTYCGVDVHARQQTVCFCNSADGEARFAELRHDRDDVRGFYSQFTGEVVVGLEASGYSFWFVELLEGLGHRVLVGDAAEIRRRARRWQKNDRRDATLILDLLRWGEFPHVHRPPAESREVLRLLRYRQKLVQMRTHAKNSLQALAYGAGSPRRAHLLSQRGRERLLQLPMGAAMSRQRDEWLSFVAEFDRRIKGLDECLVAAGLTGRARGAAADTARHRSTGCSSPGPHVRAGESLRRRVESGRLRRARPDGIFLRRAAAVWLN